LSCDGVIVFTEPKHHAVERFRFTFPLRGSGAGCRIRGAARGFGGGGECVVKAVLWDMDGTLVDSEKHWDVSLAALYETFGGVLSPAVRASMVGSVAENTMRIVYTDLGLELDPDAMARSSRWLNDYTADLFEGGLPWCDGARELLGALAAERTPMALVTNTQRALTERALNGIGRHYFSATVCGDEVPSGKPAPDPYLRAAALLGVAPEACLAIEDSVTGTAAAERAGCPVLVVPNDVEVPGGARRRHVSSLAGLHVTDLRLIHSQLITQFRERTA
jgi:HAD superfamily hydrolase (TIGR01509 family)